MKKFFSTLSILALTTTLNLGLAHAQDAMDVASMKEMKKECMTEHKDNKLCHKQVLKKCEEKLTKKECTKMMKQMHKEMKKEK